MGEITKDSSLGVKVKSAQTQDLIHGTAVSFCPERRIAADGEYGVLDEVGSAPVFLWSGLNSSFGIDIEEAHEEIQHNPVHATTNILELIRNVSVGEDLGFGLTTVPQVTGHFPLLKYITGSVTGFGDEPDSMSWLKELAGRFSLFTGIMFEDYKCDLPARGVAKESISGFAGHRVAISGVNPGDSGTDANENVSRPVVWNDIQSIRMGESAAPTGVITDCISDISFGFASEVKRETHPESTLTTKIKGVRVVSRKMFVSMKLTWVDQEFLDIVKGSLKQYLKIVIGTGADTATMEFGGLYFPKYISKGEPKNLVGDTVTCIIDQPAFTRSTGV
jgi:hypothetical protein